MRAEGPKERPTTHSSSSTMCWSAKCAKAAQNMAPLEKDVFCPVRIQCSAHVRSADMVACI